MSAQNKNPQIIWESPLTIMDGYKSHSEIYKPG